MRPVPIGIDADLAAFLTDARTAIRQLQNPGQPTQEFAITSLLLPPAANYKNCRVLVADKNTLAISTNVAGTWTWLRADGSAI